MGRSTTIPGKSMKYADHAAEIRYAQSGMIAPTDTLIVVAQFFFSNQLSCASRYRTPCGASISHTCLFLPFSPCVLTIPHSAPIFSWLLLHDVSFGDFSEWHGANVSGHDDGVIRIRIGLPLSLPRTGLIVGAVVDPACARTFREGKSSHFLAGVCLVVLSALFAVDFKSMH